MKAVIKVGRTDTMVSSYNLFFDNGLRLKVDVLWAGKAEHERIIKQFEEVVSALILGGISVTGDSL